MSAFSKNALLRLACGLYRGLLYGYPPEFRSRYGVEMSQLFRDQLRDALANQGFLGFLPFCMRTASGPLEKHSAGTIQFAERGWNALPGRGLGLCTVRDIRRSSQRRRGLSHPDGCARWLVYAGSGSSPPRLALGIDPWARGPFFRTTACPSRSPGFPGQLGNIGGFVDPRPHRRIHGLNPATRRCRGTMRRMQQPRSRRGSREVNIVGDVAIRPRVKVEIELQQMPPSYLSGAGKFKAQLMQKQDRPIVINGRVEDQLQGIVLTRVMRRLLNQNAGHFAPTPRLPGGIHAQPADMGNLLIVFHDRN